LLFWRMPFFRFIIHGQGIAIEGRAGVAGFYTTRWVFAATQDEAARKAIEAVRRDWTIGPFSKLSPGFPPTSVAIDQGWQIGLHEIWSAPNKGYTFYFDPAE
jgi:hypothetical protein